MYVEVWQLRGEVSKLHTKSVGSRPYWPRLSESDPKTRINLNIAKELLTILGRMSDLEETVIAMFIERDTE